MNPWNGWPEVTHCVIFLRQSEEKLALEGDAFLQNTAVNKYHIGIGQKIKTHRNIESISGLTMPLNYPLVQIETKRGLVALKCPTISGGKWMEKVEYPLCGDADLVMKDQTVNIIT